jgi:uncharacterized protein (DUF58 family)
VRTRPAAWLGSSERGSEPLINLSEITEIELVIRKRMREFTLGDHASVFHGTGFDFVGLREWQAGDRFETIDWAQSTLTNFSPLIVRDFEQPTTASVIVVADASLSTRCGIDGVPIAASIARAIATIGMSAVFFQDRFGLITFSDRLSDMGAVRPRTGKAQVIHCLDAYQHGHGLQEIRQAGSLSGTLTGFTRRTSLIPVVSDFLFADAADVLRELALVNTVHDVFLTIVDAVSAFELPDVSAGWVDAFDVESSRSRTMTRKDLRRMAGRVREWQDEIARLAKQSDLDVLRLEFDQTKADIAMMEFVIERRLRKK